MLQSGWVIQTTYISDTNRVQCRQLVDGQAVGIVSSCGEQCSRGVELNSVDPTALLVQPGTGASCGVIMPPRHHCIQHPRASTTTLPVLQHGNACYLPSQDIGYKKLQIKGRQEIWLSQHEEEQKEKS